MRAIPGMATLWLLTINGCAGSVEVTRTYTPSAAAEVQSDKFVPVAVMRGADRIPLPKDARVEDGRVVVRALYVHKLRPRDVIQEDSLGRIVAVRSGAPPVVTHLVPGTAVSRSRSNEVRGQLVDNAATMALVRDDGVVMHGRLEADDALPDGGHIESSRSTGALIGGAVVFVLSYAPTLYIGAGSPRSSDRVLAVPIVGPWLDLANRPACVAPNLPVKVPIDLCIEETASRAALIASGSLQGLATVLTLIGLPSHTRVVEGVDRGVGARAKPRLAVVPTLGGALAVGTF
jgi:hypothetical protein